MGQERHLRSFSVTLRMLLHSEDGSRLSGRAGKIPHGLMGLWLLHPREMCKPKKTYRGSKEKELRAPWSSQAVLPALSSSGHL